MLDRLFAAIVDSPPLRLWQPANDYFRGRVHFCVGSIEHGGTSDSVRTVEWNGREIVHGHRPFSHDEWERRWPADQVSRDADEAVTCAFCGVAVGYTDEDPIGIGVVEQWRPHDEEIDWMVYSHRHCLLTRLHPDVREVVELD